MYAWACNSDHQRPKHKCKTSVSIQVGPESREQHVGFLQSPAKSAIDVANHQPLLVVGMYKAGSSSDQGC